MWVFETVLEAMADGFARAADAVELEQAVRGIDSREELALHPLVRESLATAGYGVFPEQRYPRDRGRRRRNEGLRCDLVVTPEGLPLVDDGSQLELFRPGCACGVGEALWIEIKTVAQFAERGPNRGYSRALQSPVWRDVTKLAADETIRHAAVLVILFTEDTLVAEHDLATWHRLGREKGLPLGAPHLGRIALNDRLGNRLCTLALFPLAK